MEINDTILELFGGTWRRPPVLSGDWTSHPELAPIRARAQALISDLSRAKFWGWKDPRTCLTLKFWRELLPEMVVLICLRHPLEVAQSMAVRTVSYASETDALNLWEVYYDNLLLQVGNDPCLVTQCASLFYEPATETTRIFAFLKQEIGGLGLCEAIKSVRPELWRSFTPDDVDGGDRLPARVRQTYQRLCLKAGPVFEMQANDVAYQNRVRLAALDKAMIRIARLEETNRAREEEILRLKSTIERLSSTITVYRIPRTLLLGSWADKRDLVGKVRRRVRAMRTRPSANSISDPLPAKV